MKLLTVVPQANDRPTLGALLDETERRLRGRTTFIRRGKRHGKRRWEHARYPGWINWESSLGGILVAEVSSRTDSEWQLLHAFVGYLDRHLGEYIDSISIRYYPA